jgi:glycosyltransferase involved in cell wall biosynthesis
MRTLILKKDNLTITETFIRRHASDLDGENFLVHGQPPKTSDGVTYEISTARRMTLRAARKLGLSSEESLNEKRYIRLLQSLNPDVVLAEFGPSGAAVHGVCKKLDIPLVVFFHGYDLHVDKVRNAYLDAYKKLFADAGAIVCGAPTMRDLLLKVGAPAKRTFVCASSGIDCSAFDFTDHDIEEVRFVHVGRFVDKKAPHLTILAFSKVLEQEPGARLEMVGTGPLLGSCVDLTIALGIEQAITFHGALPHEQVVNILTGARAFVQHSVVAQDGDSEGTALTVLEAAACRIPAVVTRHGGFLDTVIDGLTGFLVDERDVDAMADRMLFLARNQEQAAIMGTQARSRVEQYFSHEKSASRLASILEWAAGKRADPPPILPPWAREPSRQAANS